MERLTRRMCGGWGVMPGYELNTVRGMKAVVDSLASYEETGLTPGKIENLTRALDAAAKLLTGYGHCTHYPGYICDKGFTTPGVCEVCIKEHLLGREKAKEG